MTNTNRYLFTNARDFRDNAELQLFAEQHPMLSVLLEQKAGGKFGYSGDCVAGNTQHYAQQLQQTLRVYHNCPVSLDFVERYLRLKFARDFAERAELIAAAGRATLLINNALFAHDEELLKPSKLVCGMLYSSMPLEQRSTAQLYKFLAGVRSVLLRAAALPGGFRLHSSITEREAKLACVDPALMPERIDNAHGDAFRDAWCFATLTFRSRLLQRAAQLATLDAATVEPARPVCVPAADRAVAPRVAGDLLVGDRFRFINDMTKYAGICELVSIAPCSYRRVVHGVGRHEWVQVDTRAQIVKL